MPCRYCEVSFSIIKWKNKCQTCSCTFCTNCIVDKRCLACHHVLDSRLNPDELLKIKIKDLKIFSTTRGYEVSTCKEKYELVNLIRRKAGLSTDGCTGHVKQSAPTSYPTQNIHKPSMSQTYYTHPSDVPVVNEAPNSVQINPNSSDVPQPPDYTFTQYMFPSANEYLNVTSASNDNKSETNQTLPMSPPLEETSTVKADENKQSPNNASSNDTPPIPIPTGLGGKLLITDIKFASQIKPLSPRQLKQILADNFVDYKGCVEKSELLKKVTDLYEDMQKNEARLAEEKSGASQVNSDEDNTCRICWDKPIDCVLLECGHMATCTACGKKLNECPFCRQYVVRCVHVFRS